MIKKEIEYVKSALNYTGGKYKLLNQIIPYFPKEFNNFIDLFCGGGVVTVNVSKLINEGVFVCHDSLIANDIDYRVIELLDYITKVNINTFIEKVEKYINLYNLSNTKKMGYEFYNCTSANGVSVYNKDKYLKLRNDYNNKFFGEDELIAFYLLIVYSFNNQIRFNSKNEFNLPVGKRDFNNNMIKKLKKFNIVLNNMNVKFISENFINIKKIKLNDFLYVDPPYSITVATYNENNGWTKENDEELFKYLDNVNNVGAKFALSNVIEHNGKINIKLVEWAKKYKIIYLDYDYNNSSYQTKAKSKKTKEVLIINY